MEVVCFSHIRWDFVYQRPQQLLTRFADHFKVFYVEEPLYQSDHDHYIEATHNNIHIVKLYLKGNEQDDNIIARQKNSSATFY